MRNHSVSKIIGLLIAGAVLLPAAFPAMGQIPVAPRFTALKLGEVMPGGWLRAQMDRDLTEGFAGHELELAPEVASDIFGAGRNTPEKPNLATSNAVDAWWNGESEGNWRTGYIMLAYLSGNAHAKAEADAYVQHILGTQDRDGYIGVYGPQLRYSTSSRSGELWTQACILRGLLAYYDLTGKPGVLRAVERAVERSMQPYGPGKATIFNIPAGAGDGVLHGLMFTDVLEHLYELTGNTAYRDFGVWMYQDFCARRGDNFQDVTLASLLNLQKPWVDHGPHTYEFLRTLLWAYFSTGKSDYEQAYLNALVKLHRYLLPSGTAVSMESIDARRPDPTSTFYEYCGTKELLTSLISGLQKTGAADLGDQVEKILFNAAEGARTAHGREIAYCTRDNRYAVDRAVLGRDKFSPAHSDIAVCCNPNATQIFPIYVRGMWMRTAEGGLAATLYGESSVKTQVRGVEVRLDEHTDYPFSSTVSIGVAVPKPTQFTLLLRNPAWSTGTEVTSPGATVARQGDYFEVRKTWARGDVVKIEFSMPVTALPAANGEFYLQRGPLVYALQIPATEIVLKQYKLAGFADLGYLPTVGADWFYALPAGAKSAASGFTFEADAQASRLFPFDEAPVRLGGKMINLNTGREESVNLIPMGSSLARLRRVTFPIQAAPCAP